jgi:hypothetical protein
MHESPAAIRAFEDYLAMPPGERSLERLVHRYQNASESPPTKRLKTLKTWSSAFTWQARIRGIATQEREQAEGQVRDTRERVMGEGLALDYRRVAKLKEIGEREAAIAQDCLEALAADVDGRDTMLLKRYQIVKRSLDGTLAAISAEVGGRTTRPLLRDLESFAVELAATEGYDLETALRFARQIAHGD